MGKILGNNWEQYHSIIKRYLIIGSLNIFIILIVIFVYRKYKQQIIDFTVSLLKNAYEIFNSFGKIKAMMAIFAVAFLGLSALVIGTTQDFLAHEFKQFDTIVSLLVKIIFTENWRHLMNIFDIATSLKTLILLTTSLILLIFIRGIDTLLEIKFSFFVIWGGEVLQSALRLIFRRLGPAGISLPEAIKFTFPSRQSFMAVVAYGFLSFIILRHTKRNWIRTISIIMAIFICFVISLNPLYYQIQYPSDVYAGYVFGGVWLTLNIILLEVNRILLLLKKAMCS